MPCWYYDKRDLLRNTPSFKDGIEADVEARYRREGARFIIDTGTKMGLRYDTCATGVVYFHRFYMFHSFKEFHRYVTAACCLFLAGKVEETPKKCKDIIKTTRSMLTDQQFTVFGDDPKEEVMTMERILLQTIKFDLQVEHPYAYLLKFSKQIKGDKSKIQKMVQMGWTFINDSLCTTLSLQWEADIIAVALMYLASRLTKFDIQDWHGKSFGYKGKWWDFLVEDTTLELLEDICHQVLDLYSSSSQAKEDSPPPPPPPPPSQGQQTPNKRSRPTTPQDQAKIMHSGQPPAKVTKLDNDKSTKTTPHSAGVPHSNLTPAGTPGAAPQSAPAAIGAATSNSNYNPYMSSQMYSSSFMSQEGSQSIQNILGGGTSIATAYNTTYPPSQPQYTQSSAASQYQTQAAGYPQTGAPQPGASAYGQPQGSYQQQQSYAQVAAAPPATAPTGQSSYSSQYPYPQQPQPQYPTSASQYQTSQPPPPAGRPQVTSSYQAAYPGSQYPTGQYGSQPPQPTTASQYSQPYPNTQTAPPPPQNYPNLSKPPPQTGMVRGPAPQQQAPGSGGQGSSGGGMPVVRITGRRR